MEWIRTNQLKLKVNKLGALLAEGNFDLGSGLSSVLDGVVLTLKKRVLSLWVLLDPDLLLDKQVAAVARGFFH